MELVNTQINFIVYFTKYFYKYKNLHYIAASFLKPSNLISVYFIQTFM